MPSDKEFLELLVKMANEKQKNEKSCCVNLADFVSQVQMVLRDEFNGEVNIEQQNTISVKFQSGQKFVLKIEECIFADLEKKASKSCKFRQQKSG